MSRINRVILIVVLVLVGLSGVAYTGTLYAARWQLVTESSAGTAYGNAAAFAPLFAPAGDWQVFIEAPARIRKPLEKALALELPKLTYGQCRVEFLTAVPVATAGVNRLSVTLTPDGHWTPVTAKFADKAEIHIFTAGQSVPPDDLSVVPGAVNIDASYTAAAAGYGLVGRPQMDAYRASVAKDFIIKTIRDAYEGLRTQASQPS